MSPPIAREETDFGAGETGASDPRVPGIPAFSANGSGSITITAPDDSGNDAVVTYSLRVTYAGPTVRYVQADGTIDTGEVFRTLAAWGATVTVTGLTDFVAYTFASRAQNELAVNSAWTSESAAMSTLPSLDGGQESATGPREITTGNVKVDDTAGLTLTTGATVSEATTGETWYAGSITIDYILKSEDSLTAVIEGQYSEDGGSTWAAATLSGGDGLTGLTTSPTGVAHDIVWDSYGDAGTSESQTDMMLRLRAQDSHGHWGAYETSAAFTLYNRPAVPTVVNSDGRAWDEDTTPTFQAVIPTLRGGTACFPVIHLYSDSAGTVYVSGYPKRSYESIAGWEYETAPNTWVAMTVAGIPSSAIDGVNRMRYTVQTALAAGSYTRSFQLYGTRDWG